MNEISANKHCECETIILVISVDRHIFVSPVTTTRDIPGVGVMFPPTKTFGRQQSTAVIYVVNIFLFHK
jgi:hypothetical protein